MIQYLHNQNTSIIYSTPAVYSFDRVKTRRENFEKKVLTMFVNISTNINKTNNHISANHFFSTNGVLVEL